MTKKRKIAAIIFSAILLTGLSVCCICDAAISRSLSWSLVSSASIVFAWLACTPAILMGRRGIAGSLISVSVFILPYLYLLSRLLRVSAVFSVGAVIAVISDLYLWAVFAIIRYMGSKRFFTYGVVCLSAIVFLLAVNALLSKLIGQPFLDVWDLLAAALLLLVSIPLLTAGRAKGLSPHAPEAHRQ